MLRKIISILLILIAVGYISYAMATFSDDASAKSCNNININVVDEDGKVFIKQSEIKRLLERNGINLKGKKVSEIDFENIEKIVEKSSLVKNAECFSSPSGALCIKVWQQTPVLRVISGGKNYYIDINGNKTGLSSSSAADVVVASGAINNKQTVSYLHRMAMLLRQNELWDAQIEQIYVEEDGEWILIPRTGNFEVLFGTPVNIEKKLTRLNLFMRDYLPEIGWDKYSKINLKFDNQIICTKKDIGNESGK
jgi:cell division protein FtsQ